jgi:hypothetical protein
MFTKKIEIIDREFTRKAKIFTNITLKRGKLKNGDFFYMSRKCRRFPRKHFAEANLASFFYICEVLRFRMAKKGILCQPFSGANKKQ